MLSELVASADPQRLPELRRRLPRAQKAMRRSEVPFYDRARSRLPACAQRPAIVDPWFSSQFTCPERMPGSFE
jgi:hypothetical protein